MAGIASEREQRISEGRVLEEVSTMQDHDHFRKLENMMHSAPFSCVQNLV